MGTGGLSPGSEADYPPPISAEAQENVDLHINSPYALMTQCLISLSQGQLYLTFTSSQIQIFLTPILKYSDTSVGIVTGYGLNGPDSIRSSARFFSSPQRPDRLCSPPSLLPQCIYPVPRSRMVEL
jgi:hypothetical protein